MGHTVCFLIASCLLLGLVGGVGAGESHEHLIVVYYTPADREPIPGYRERLDRIMTDVQAFYREQMERNGYGPMTFDLERDTEGRLVVHPVKGDRTYAKEETIETGEIRDRQVKPALLKEGIDIEHEHVVIFQNLLFIDDENSITCWAPYCGGGDHKNGTAYVTDCTFVDPPNLLRDEPTIVDCGRNRTLGNYVMAQTGGVTHEFGHSLGLPHNMETPEQLKTLGTALMGSGNYTYRRERTGKGLGSFLSTAHALALSRHPLFKRSGKDVGVDPACALRDLQFSRKDAQLLATGRAKSAVPIYGLIAYLDPLPQRRDYDSRSRVAQIDREGSFTVGVSDLDTGLYELRLRFCHDNGAHTEFAYRYVIEEAGVPPVTYLNRQMIYQKHVLPAYEAKDEAALSAGIGKLKDQSDIWYRKAKQLHCLLTQGETKPRKLSELGEDTREVWVSSVEWESASVGWEEPLRDRRADTGYLLESGRDVHATGLYAHAPSRYVYKLGGKWKRLDGGCGLQNWVPGTVAFVIKGDGKELYHSPKITDWTEHRFDVDLSDVDVLELIADPTEDGKYADCSVWFSPRLTR